MRSILKVAISFTILMISSVFLVAQAGQKNVCNTAKDITKPQIFKYEQISKICIDSQLFSLTYNYPKRLLSITSHQSGQRIYYDKLQKGYNPEYVMGGDGGAIRFLPMKLQPYLNQGKVLYFSSTRTTAGNGMGQCGAGLETFLNVFDIKSKRPVRVSSILISSCTENIELAIRNPTIDDVDYTDLSIISGRLKIVFTSYKEKRYEKIEDAPAAILSGDLKTLEFITGE